MNLLRAISRLIIGFTFIFSGFVKIIDPVGVGLIVGEYFKIIGIGSLPALFQIIGIVLSGTELLLGISILLGLRMKISSKAVLVFISGFTLITLFLALFNPIQECGCFGEALKLTNWQTFYKNVFLLCLALVLFFHRDRFIPIAPKNWEWGFVGVYAILIILLSVYSSRHLPLIDFLDLKVGTNIPEVLSMTENISEPSYETVLIYKKEGKLKEYSINELPDSTWIFVDSKSKKIASRSIKNELNFAISDRNGSYVTDSILSKLESLFITSVPYLESLSDSDYNKIKEINKKLKKRNIAHIVLSGSSVQMVDSLFRDSLKIDVFYTDHKTLLTLNRSNGGLVYLNDGIISAKWSLNYMPIETFDNILKEDPELLAAKSRIKEQLAAEVTAIIILLLIVVMRYVCRFAYTHKNILDGNSTKQESKES